METGLVQQQQQQLMKSNRDIKEEHVWENLVYCKTNLRGFVSVLTGGEPGVFADSAVVRYAAFRWKCLCI